MNDTTVNGVTCNTCGATVISTHRHDFKWCDCPPDSNTCVAVDGGNDYRKRCFGNNASWEEL